MTPLPAWTPVGQPPPPRTPRGQLAAARPPFAVLAAIFVLANFILASAAPCAAAKVEIKLATQAPENTPWHKLLVDMNTEWQALSGGDVSLVIYPGGVSGDESDIIRKIRIGQLHAGALTVSALTDLDDYFSVFQIPLFFDSWDELNYVLEDLTPLLVQRLDQKGFVWLTWGHVGWVHFFTKSPVARINDLRKLKIFTWAGNDRMVQWWKRNGFNPVALALPDALQGLRTGLIETMISPPLAALSLQWFKEAPNMIDIGLVPMVGAIVVSKRTWERIDEKHRGPLLAAAASVGAQLQSHIPGMDQFAITTMKGQGLTVLEIRDSPHSAEWLAEAIKFADEMRGDMVPTEIFDRALQKRDEFRARRSSQQQQPAATGTVP
ncbi:MAG TPA: TRAP transporter substrate-binding protein DctP [Thermoanaerobaculia bacterium]|nr:TRAP transporter substrate-binding protein DctP [Thermoanaerobaculia bacterium]